MLNTSPKSGFKV